MLFSFYEPRKNTPYLALIGDPWGVSSGLLREKIPQDIANTLYDNLQIIWFKHEYSFKQVHEHWKPWAFTMTALTPVVLPEIVVMITYCAASDDTAGTVTTFGLDERNFWDKFHTNYMMPILR